MHTVACQVGELKQIFSSFIPSHSSVQRSKAGVKRKKAKDPVRAAENVVVSKSSQCVAPRLSPPTHSADVDRSPVPYQLINLE